MAFLFIRNNLRIDSRSRALTFTSTVYAIRRRGNAHICDTSAGTYDIRRGNIE